MRKTVLAVAAALLLCAPMTACGGAGGFASPLPPGGVLGSTLTDDKAVFAAEAAYAGVAAAAEAAVDAGLLRGERAAQVAVIDRRAHTALQVARRAHRAGNTSSAAVAAGQVLAAVADIQQLLKPQPG